MNIDDLIAQESEKLAYLHFCPEVKLALETKTADLSQYRNSLIGAGAGGLAGAFHGYAKRRGSLKQALKDALIGALAGGGVGYATDVARGAGGLGLFDGADAGQASTGNGAEAGQAPPAGDTTGPRRANLTVGDKPYAKQMAAKSPAEAGPGNPSYESLDPYAEDILDQERIGEWAPAAIPGNDYSDALGLPDQQSLRSTPTPGTLTEEAVKSRAFSQKNQALEAKMQGVGGPYVDAVLNRLPPPSEKGLGMPNPVLPVPGAVDALDDRDFMDRIGDELADIPVVGSLPTNAEEMVNLLRSDDTIPLGATDPNARDAIQRVINNNSPYDWYSNVANNAMDAGLPINPGSIATAGAAGIGAGATFSPVVRATGNIVRGQGNKALQALRSKTPGAVLDQANNSKNPWNVVKNYLNEKDWKTLRDATNEVNTFNGDPSGRIATQWTVQDALERSKKPLPTILDANGKPIPPTTPRQAFYSDPDAVARAHRNLLEAETTGRRPGWKPATKKPIFGGKRFSTIPGIAGALGAYYLGNNNTPTN